MENTFWKNKRVAVTGGANLVGTHLIQHLISEGVGHIWTIDDLSAGKAENVPDGVDLWKCDLRDYNLARRALATADIVFHLAAQHGGRAYVNTHAVNCWQNAELDGAVFRACADVQVPKVVYMSSACAYDTSIQQDLDTDLKLSESIIDYSKPILADGAYGTQKHQSEVVLNAYIQGDYFDGAIVRGFTIYGAGVSLTHFIGAAIARTYIQQDPLVIFGNGTQKRNWTMVKDTARGIALTAQYGMDGEVFNIGTEEANTPNTVYEHLWDIFGWKPSNIKYRPNELVGTINRIADATKAREELGWIPEYDIRRGLEETVDWFVNKYTVDQVREGFERKLFEL